MNNSSLSEDVIVSRKDFGPLIRRLIRVTRRKARKRPRVERRERIVLHKKIEDLTLENLRLKAELAEVGEIISGGHEDHPKSEVHICGLSDANKIQLAENAAYFIRVTSEAVDETRGYGSLDPSHPLHMRREDVEQHVRGLRHHCVDFLLGSEGEGLCPRLFRHLSVEPCVETSEAFAQTSLVASPDLHPEDPDDDGWATDLSPSPVPSPSPVRPLTPEVLRPPTPPHEDVVSAEPAILLRDLFRVARQEVPVIPKSGNDIRGYSALLRGFGAAAIGLSASRAFDDYSQEAIQVVQDWEGPQRMQALS
jgi:hypothetical protein